MEIKPQLIQKHQQRLVMTVALRQAIEVLQMPQIDLALWIRQEIEKNPLLEEKTPENSPLGFFDNEIASTTSLEEFIERQIQESSLSDREKKIANRLQGYLDEKGYLSASEEEISNELEIELEVVKSILSVLKTFDPPGIFAKNLQETLLLQLKAIGEGKTTSYLLIQECFEDLLNGRFKNIEKKLGKIELSSAVQKLTRLSFRPAEHFQTEQAPSIIPDLRLTKSDEKWMVEVAEDTLPKFEYRSEYEKIKTDSDQEKEALREWIVSVKWLYRSLKKRRQIILSIGILILKKQIDYLEDQGNLAPLSMKEACQYLDIHESTLSRALSGKYIATPRGIAPLKSFFSPEKKRIGIEEAILEIVKNEDRKNPLSDEQIARELSKAGNKVARRTISKYRKKLKIPARSLRKHLSI